MTLPGPLGVGIALRSWQAALGGLGLDPASFPQDVAGGFPRAEVPPGAGELATVSQRAERLERQQLKGHNS